MRFLKKLFGGHAADPPTETSAVAERLARLRERDAGIDYTATPPPQPVPPRASINMAGSAGRSPPPVVLARKPRARDRDWTHDMSWFGGLPKLASAPWPRGANGRPLPFVAQVSLAEIAAACPKTPLPLEGWLAFFLNDGAVIHVQGRDLEPTPAPEDLLPAYCEGGHTFPEQPSRTDRPTFPFWPVEAIGLPLPQQLRAYSDPQCHKEIWEMQRQLLAEQLPPREYFFSVYSARKAGIEGADLLWWYGALHVQHKLRDALDSVEDAIALRESWIQRACEQQVRLAAEKPPNEAKIEAARADEQRYRDQIPEIRLQAAELATLVTEYEKFTAGCNPWTEMAQQDIATLKEFMGNARKAFPLLTTYHIPVRIDDVRDLCIRHMITDEQDAFAALPDPLVSFINANYRLPTENPHQMFGLAGVIQDKLYDHLEDLLLLQLSYDDLNEWRFGDMGLWQFWISPADVAARRWERAKLTFEMS